MGKNKDDAEVHVLEKADAKTQEIDFLETTLAPMLKVSTAIATAFDLHKRDGECYKLMERILNQYRLLKYSVIYHKTKSTYLSCLKELTDEGFLSDVTEKDEYTPADVYDALDLSDSLSFAGNALSRWLASSTMPYEYLVVNLVDRLIQIIETKFGDRGVEQANLLRLTYLNPETEGLKYDELCAIMGLKKSTFYNIKQEAIRNMSILFFSPLGIRHRASPFYQGESK